MRKITLSLLILPLLISIGGCTTAKISGRGTQPILLNQLDRKGEAVGKVNKKEMRTFDYTGAVDVSEVIGGKLSQSEADAMTNTTVSMGSSPGSFFLNLITLGLANAHTVTVNGDLVRIESPSAVVQPPVQDSVRVQPVGPVKTDFAHTQRSAR